MRLTGFGEFKGPAGRAPKRITLFTGHYGSGKTNIAVNYAFYLKGEGFPTAIGDLDIVNPYFRTKDSEEELHAAGIDVISLKFANSSVDLPSLPQEAYSLVQNRARHAVLDIGGDDRGAFALGRYTPYILEENDFDMFYVANFMRPLTRSPEEAFEVMQEIAAVCGIPFTGIVNNSNLAGETTADTVLETEEKAKALSGLSGVPVVMTSCIGGLSEALSSRLSDVFPMALQQKITDTP